MLGAMRNVLVIALGFALLFVSVSAQGERRVALVIGNDKYAHLPDLNNAGKDARDMAAKLEFLGFEVIARYNASRRDMGRAIRKFSARLSAGGTGLVFYAGHGIQADGTNYLVPANANIEIEDDLQFEAMDSNIFLQAMKDAGNPLNIFIIDACRNNPLPKRSRSAARGLAITAVPSGVKGTAILYAAGPGQTAADGQKGGNGVFTGALLKHMDRPGLTLEQVFKATSREVLKETNNRQRPWQLVSMQGDFVFRAAKPVAPAPAAPVRAPQPDHTVELTFWNSVKDSNDPAAIETYLGRYPSGIFASLARVRIAALKAKAARSGEAAERAGSKQRQQAKAEAELARKRSEQQAARARERELWDAVASSKDPAVVQAFLKRYPKSDYAALARARLSTLTTRSSRVPQIPSQPEQKVALATPKAPKADLWRKLNGNWFGELPVCGVTSGGWAQEFSIRFSLRQGLIEGKLRQTTTWESELWTVKGNIDADGKFLIPIHLYGGGIAEFAGTVDFVSGTIVAKINDCKLSIRRQ